MVTAERQASEKAWLKRKFRVNRWRFEDFDRFWRSFLTPLSLGKKGGQTANAQFIYILYTVYVWSPIKTLYKQYLFCIYHYPFLPSRLVHLRCPIRLSYWVVPQGVGELFQVKLAKTKMELAAVEMEVPG